MELLHSLLDFLLHLDQHLSDFIQHYGVWTYGILFLIIFVETGVVVMPFLPGDSLLFAVGSFAAKGDFNLLTLLILLSAAAILGDATNYLIGKFFGKQILKLTFRGKPIIKPEHLAKTESFYADYGAKTIVIARFVPIVRTLAPFVAGIGKMDYGKFFSYNIGGGLVWVLSLTLAGYFFGQLPIVKNNFELVVFSIIGLSLLPILVEFIKARLRRS